MALAPYFRELVDAGGPRERETSLGLFVECRSCSRARQFWLPDRRPSGKEVEACHEPLPIPPSKASRFSLLDGPGMLRAFGSVNRTVKISGAECAVAKTLVGQSWGVRTSR